MQLQSLVHTSREVARTRSRKQKIELLASFLGALKGDDLEIGLAYLVGEFRQGRIGLGWAMARQAREAARPRETAELTLSDVDGLFTEIQETTGSGSKARRLELLQELFELATEDERSYLTDLIGGEIRQGAQEAILVEAVAKAAGLDVDAVRRAVMFGGELREVAKSALREGLAGLEQFRLTPLRPVRPMLAGAAREADEILERYGQAAFEWKLDGARIQVHKARGRVRVFTRKLHDVTSSVPEIVELVSNLPVRDVVLDGEAVAFDEHGRPRPFQVTMSRFARKLDVEEQRARIPLTPVFFDILHADGRSYVDRGCMERRDALERTVPPQYVVQRLLTIHQDEANAFYAEAIDRGYEGLVAKALDAPYEAGRRGMRWLKLKPSHTLDLVVLAAEWGSGRRRGWLSNLHLGARHGDGFCMLGKTFKGMTDRTLEEQTRALLSCEARREGQVVHVRPELVVEVAFDGVQESPQYPGGVALRFARLKRYRDDKSAAEADTLDTVRSLRA